MTYLYYKSSYTTNTTKPNEKTNPDNEEWHAVTRRETIEGAETAIDGSIDHFSKKIEATQGPKVIKTFK